MMAEIGTHRARSFMVRGWPKRARRFLTRAFLAKKAGAGLTWGELAAELKTKFGVVTNDSSLSRYFSFWLSSGEPRLGALAQGSPGGRLHIVRLFRWIRRRLLLDGKN